MGIYSWLRSIADRVKMACVYPDQVIRIGEGLEEGAAISDEIRARWKEESDRQVKGLMAQKERELMAQKAQQEYEEGLEPMEAFQDPDLVNPVPIADAATTPHELKQLQVDLTDLRKSIPNEWETADEVFKNINLFNDWLPRTQWNYNPKAKIYLMFNTLPRNLKKQLIKVGWTKRCADQDTTRGSLQAMQNWILSWRHVRPKGETALRALYTQELRQGPKEQLRTWYEKIQEVGEDAYGHNKYLWSLPQRRIVAQAFIVGCRYNKANWHLKQDTLEGLDERLIDVHLDHCRNVFEESKVCENQHPYVSLQREAERHPTAAPAAATTRTNHSTNRMSVDPSRNSSNRMSVQAVAGAREERFPFRCYNCGQEGHAIRQCTNPHVPGQGPRQEGSRGGPRGRLQGRGQPPPPRRERNREEDRPRQVQQVAAAPAPAPAGDWATQRVAACTGSAVSSGINNIGNNVLLNLDVGPGKRDINSVAGVAVCYDTGQMTTYPLIMSQTFFTSVMGELKALDPPICQEKVTGASGVELIPLGCFKTQVSFPLLLDFPPVELTCCVYSNLTSDILMGSAYLKCVSLSNPLSVSQRPSGYVFNSTNYSQPSLTSREAHECNMMLARHVYSANPGTTGNHYSNPGLKQILEKWETEGRALPQKPPPLRVQGVATDKYGGIHPQAPSLNAKGWPCQESLVGPNQN